MRCIAALAAIACLVDSVASTAWIPTSARSQRRNNVVPTPTGFVSTSDGHFTVDGKPFFYLGTNAYWLQHLSDDDIDLTMKSIAAKNLSVVRTWAFNDVFEIPESGAWFQLFNPNGTVTFNTGPNGLQRLDKILDSAKQHNLRVQFALTNNWNPVQNATNVTSTSLVKRANTTANVTLPRGTLSNDYGGMDAYVRAHNLTDHDQFYTNQTLINAFQNFLDVLVPRYSNNTQLLSWELANDPRCNSSLPNAPTCNSTVVTKWHSIIAAHVKQLDPNHTIASGTQGFQCMGCPKLFPPITPPAPQTSPAPGKKKRTLPPFTLKSISNERRNRFRRNAEALRKRTEKAVEKRGDKTKWMYRRPAVNAKRQSAAGTQNVAALDGSHGVDSQDILGIPQIGFSTFQFFPDQNTYVPLDPSLDAFNNTIQAGLDWITQQVQAAQIFGKPVALTGFGLVTQTNLPFFVPFNDTQPLFPVNTTTNVAQVPIPTSLGVGIEQGQVPVSDEQQQVAYTTWLQHAIDLDISGITHYQWGQVNLTAPPVQGQVSVANSTFVPELGQQNVSPNDGYQTVSQAVQNILQNASLQQQAKNVLP